MSKSARSVFGLSVYLFVLGAILIVIPNYLLQLLPSPESNDVWIRVVGVSVFILGFDYFQASRVRYQKIFSMDDLWPNCGSYFFHFFLCYSYLFSQSFYSLA